MGEFRTLSFQDQVDTVAQDLREHFWGEDAHVVCVSFGAYLFLHAQAQLVPFIGKVLLLSPIVGEFSNDNAGHTFRPPRATRLRTLAEHGQYPAPLDCEIHVGELDWQSVPADVVAFGRLTRLPVHVAPGRGHDLGKDYVGPVLDRWLGRPPTASPPMSELPA